ncbi:hypothetical protein [Actinophytocola oryzae]|uniref:Uncharacterized protein n=1 Tax=Actinophytocola oryzae TaxID=502181 RepID=A0A4R7W1L6_9PSEU|nr:hypothetical protein [Actinophytocola oryzae]TDV56302.1 hypothetical protein CLV71_102368 [Actinophytocola oryzae]
MITRWRRSCPFVGGLPTAGARVELLVVANTSPGLLRFTGAGATAS